MYSSGTPKISGFNHQHNQPSDKRTHVVSSLSTVNTDFPISLRYPGCQIYVHDEQQWYFLDCQTYSEVLTASWKVLGIDQVEWNAIVNKPVSFPPSSHTHPLSEMEYAGVTDGYIPVKTPTGWEAQEISVGFIEKAFNSVIQLDKNYYTVHTIAGAIAFTYNSASNRLINKHIFFLTADGTNKPTFSNDFEVIWDNWMNDNGAVNRIEFEQGSNKVLVHLQYVLAP